MEDEISGFTFKFQMNRCRRYRFTWTLAAEAHRTRVPLAPCIAGSAERGRHEPGTAWASPAQLPAQVLASRWRLRPMVNMDRLSVPSAHFSDQSAQSAEVPIDRPTSDSTENEVRTLLPSEMLRTFPRALS